MAPYHCHKTYLYISICQFPPPPFLSLSLFLPLPPSLSFSPHLSLSPSLPISLLNGCSVAMFLVTVFGEGREWGGEGGAGAVIPYFFKHFSNGSPTVFVKTGQAIYMWVIDLPYLAASKVLFNKKNTLISFIALSYKLLSHGSQFGASFINSHRFRYTSTSSDWLCLFCPQIVQDEFHFLFICPIYFYLRCRYVLSFLSVLAMRVAFELNPRFSYHIANTARYLFMLYK